MAPANWMLWWKMLSVLDSTTDIRWRRVQVGGGEVVAGDERPLLVDDLVDTEVGVEVGLDVLKKGNGAVSTSTSAKHQY